jgi:predicted Zn-dependent protease
VALLSAALGVVGLYQLYGAAERGGRLVYSYAGGVGIKEGNPDDVGRLLLAGLYHQAQLDRKAGRGEAAARLFEEAARRFPSDQELQLLAAESLLRDRRDPEAAIAALERFQPAKQYLRVKKAVLTADALEAAGRPADARATLETLLQELPNDGELRSRLARLRQ